MKAFKQKLAPLFGYGEHSCAVCYAIAEFNEHLKVFVMVSSGLLLIAVVSMVVIRIHDSISAL
jgi:hypothetical protein